MARRWIRRCSNRRRPCSSPIWISCYPGALAAARRSEAGHVTVHLEHWPSNPLSRGSYTCYQPGQFTTIAGHEGTSVGNLHFAGEHTNSFYEWQGFMEGAALSGIDAAQRILKGA